MDFEAISGLQIVIWLIQPVAIFNFGLIGCYLLFFAKVHKTLAGQLLGLFMLGKSFTLLSNLIFSFYSISNQGLITLAIFSSSFLFFYAPFIFGFAEGIVFRQWSLKKKWVHFIPFGLLTLLNVSRIVAYYFQWDSYILLQVNWIYKTYLIHLYYLQVLIYTVLAYKVLKVESKFTKLIHAEKRKKAIQLLKNIIRWFLSVWACFLLEYLSDTFGFSSTVSTVFFISGLVLLVGLTNFLLVVLIRNQDLLSLTTSNLKILNQKKEVAHHNDKESFDKICQKVEEEELFCDPDLSIQDLAEIMHLPERNTSQLINTFHGANFNDFINQYRIDQAKKLLKDFPDMTVVNIQYDVGFRSKSVFYTAFKKQVGQTPTQYRKEALQLIKQ